MQNPHPLYPWSVVYCETDGTLTLDPTPRSREQARFLDIAWSKEGAANGWPLTRLVPLPMTGNG